MAYTPHALMQITGTLGSVSSPGEIFSTSIRMIVREGVLIGQGDRVTPTEDECREYLATNWGAVLAKMEVQDGTNGALAHITEVKLNAIGEDGKYVHPTTVSEPVENRPFGMTSNGRVPFQVAAVLTLETGFQRGHASKGRMYLPVPPMGISTDGLFTSIPAITAQWAEIIGDLRTTVEIDGRTTNWVPAVCSNVGTPGSNFRDVTSVSMDSRPDVQRRRANDLRGSRTLVPLD